MLTPALLVVIVVGTRDAPLLRRRPGVGAGVTPSKCSDTHKTDKHQSCHGWTSVGAVTNVSVTAFSCSSIVPAIPAWFDEHSRNSSQSPTHYLCESAQPRSCGRGG